MILPPAIFEVLDFLSSDEIVALGHLDGYVKSADICHGTPAREGEKRKVRTKEQRKSKERRKVIKVFFSGETTRKSKVERVAENSPSLPRTKVAQTHVSQRINGSRKNAMRACDIRKDSFQRTIHERQPYDVSRSKAGNSGAAEN